MRTRLSHWFRRTPAHRGQTLVLFALMSLTLIAGLGLVIDAGVNYGQRRTMQNAADTAALAGVRILSRQNTFPGTTRQMVWNAVYSTAVSNGVKNDPTIFQCFFVKNDRGTYTDNSCNIPVDGGGALDIPTWASGVQVRVSETHQTFFMRALGTTTSGTSAVSMAQVRIASFMPTTDLMFAVCGVDTATRVTSGTGFGSGTSDMLTTSYKDDWTLQPPPSPGASPYPQKKVATEPKTEIVSGAYKFDWNQRDLLGNLTDLGGPTFQIYSPDIAPCEAKDSAWKGLISQARNPNGQIQDIQMTPDGDALYGPPVNISSGPISSNTLAHSVNGTLGCEKGDLPPLLGAGGTPRATNLADDGCIMFVPVVDNGGGPRFASAGLRGRVWGVFYVFNAGGNYYGWLIKNYPVHEDGETLWSKTYTGPITVTLVKAE